MSKRWLMRMIGMIAITLLLSGCSAQAVERQATGTLEADSVSVSAEVGGIVKEIVAEGTKIRPGDVIAKLDTSMAEFQAAQAKAAYEGAVARLDELQAGSRSEQIRSAQASVDALRAQADGAAQGLNDAKGALDVVREQLDKTPENSPLHPTLKAQEQELIAKVDAAQAQVQTLQAQKAGAEAQVSLLKAGAPKQALAAAEASVSQAKAFWEGAQIQVEKGTVKAPVEGTVQTAVLHTGELALPGSVLLRFAAQTWSVTIYVPQKNLADFAPGKTVHLQTEALPDSRFDGQVAAMSTTAEFTPKNISTPKGREALVFAVKISVPTQEKARPGMTVIATW